MGNILELFEGLTESQVKELRGYILPILKALRNAIVKHDEVSNSYSGMYPLADKKE